MARLNTQLEAEAAEFFVLANLLLINMMEIIS